MLQEWIPDAVWLNVLALDNMDAFRGLPDAVARGDAAWRAWCAAWNGQLVDMHSFASHKNHAHCSRCLKTSS